MNEEHSGIKKRLHEKCRFLNVSGKAREWLKFCCLRVLDYFQRMEQWRAVCHKERQNEIVVCLAVQAGM